MRTAAFVAALALLAGCKMPTPPAGYQFSCASDGECPSGTVCSMSCCVKAGEQPTCVTAVGVGTGCTGGCPSVDGGCPGSCPSDLACFDELRVGLPGGLCSLDCTAASCPAVSVEDFEQAQVMDCVDVSKLALPAGKLCLRRCSPEADHASDCRPGWTCDCPQAGEACHCLPRCSAGSTADGGTACAKAPDGGAMVCQVATGLCRRPEPGPDAGMLDAGDLDAGGLDAEDPGPDAGGAWSACLGGGYYTGCADYCTKTYRRCVETCAVPGDDAGTSAATVSFDNTSYCSLPGPIRGGCEIMWSGTYGWYCCCQ